MRKIKNPWQEAHIFKCFGCDKTNPIGLKLDFFEDGNQVCCRWNPASHYQGYVDTLHGGIHATLHDELASWVIYVKGKTAGMTSEIKVTYIKPVLVEAGEIKVVGEIIEQNNKQMAVRTQLFNHQNELCSEALVVYRVFPQELAIKKLYYPGPDAFFE